QHALDVKRLTDSCRQTYFALPDEFKLKLGQYEPDDWVAVTYPDRSDLTTLSAETKTLDGVKRKLRMALDDAAKVQTVRAKLDSGRDRRTKARQSRRAAEAAAQQQAQ